MVIRGLKINIMRMNDQIAVGQRNIHIIMSFHVQIFII